MQEVTQQRIDESDLKIAKTFKSVGISKDASIVFVTMLQSTKAEINQSEIVAISGLPQGVVSKGINELINRAWVNILANGDAKGKGRPTRIYKTAPINVAIKDLQEHLKTYTETVKADIATIKETYK
jgi:predicted transcriptional regulator